MPIRCTKHVYAPPEADDGCRLIVMRRYPRGVAKWRAHGFLPDLAPTLPLVHWYHEQKNAIEAQWRNTDPERFGTEIARFWRVYSRRYLSEMRRQRQLIEWLSALERDFGLTLTLLCACDDHRLCHRSLLADLIAETDLEADDFDPPVPLVPVAVVHSRRISEGMRCPFPLFSPPRPHALYFRQDQHLASSAPALRLGPTGGIQSP